MRIAVAVRRDENLTNKRVRCLGQGFQSMGHEVRYVPRESNVRGYDLLVQAGFAPSSALISAIKHKVPYLIAEGPTWRGRDNEAAEATRISWTYNGLLGGGFHHPAPSQGRSHPKLQPLKKEGATIIFAQKPNDHSLRGHDHVAWLQVQLAQYPDAEFRHHPLMARAKYARENIMDALDRCHRAITYSSTVGVEALVAGCISKPDDSKSSAYGVTDREAWIHELSWWDFTMEEASKAEAITHILDGYDEALDRSKRMLVEIPRAKCLGADQMKEYYRRFGNE